MELHIEKKKVLLLVTTSLDFQKYSTFTAHVPVYSSHAYTHESSTVEILPDSSVTQYTLLVTVSMTVDTSVGSYISDVL